MRLIPLIFMALLAVSAGVSSAQESAAKAQIVVIGHGSATAVPDQATLRLGARYFGKSAQEALSETSARTEAILARLSTSGIAARDVQTSSVRLNPVWGDYKRGENGEPVPPLGFEASNDITAIVRDLTQLGTLLDAVAGDGANSFSGFQFGLQNRAPLEAQARSRAVADAMEKAEEYATDAGIKLGEVLVITEELGGGGGFPAPVAEMAMARSGGVPIAQGEIDITAQVKMIFSAGPWN